MSISAVGSQAAGNQNASGTSVSKAFPVNITSGNMISVIGIKFSPSSDAFASGDVTKTAGTATIGTINFRVNVNFNYSGSNFIAVGIWDADVTGSGSCTMQVGGAVASSALIIAINEYTSTNGAITFDTGKTTTGTGASGAPTGSSLTPSQYNGLIVGGLATATSGSTTHTPGSGWSQIFEDENGATDMTGSAIYQILASGSATVNWSAPTTVPWAVAGAGYVEPAGGGSSGRGYTNFLPMTGVLRHEKAA